MLTDSEAEEFVYRHWALAQRVIGGRARWTYGRNRDQIRSDGNLALWEAAKTYNPDRGPEEPFVIQTIQFRLIDRYRERHGRGVGFHDDPEFMTDYQAANLRSPDNSLEEMINDMALVQVMVKLPPRYRWLLTEYYLKGRKMHDMARELKVTESRVSQKVTEALKHARRLIENKENN
jgi:RNA polymerase sigma factor (sigma-70 family)